MGRSHGSSQACYFGDRPESGTCDPCRVYSRDLKQRERLIRGTYAFNAVHGIGPAGAVRAACQRKYGGTLQGVLTSIRGIASQRGVK